MKKNTIHVILAAAAIAVGVASLTGAAEQSMRMGKGVGTSAPFSVTGMFNGSLSGEVVVNGQSVFITEKTTVHQVGVGPVDQGVSVTNAPVIVSGVMKGKKAVATMVVIGERESSNDYSQVTIEGAEVDSQTSRRAR